LFSIPSVFSVGSSKITATLRPVDPQIAAQRMHSSLCMSRVR
jgi:hypothetical protein